jgi:dephospho-CoA kinase
MFEQTGEVTSMILGLTGGIAAGKSTVTAMLRKRGIPVIDADAIAREVVEPGKPAYEAIVRHFGRGILLSDGQIDRKKLGEIIFSDETERQALNAIVHPEVRREMRERAEQAEREGAEIVFMDIPLLFESKLQHMVDKIVVVYVPASIQMERLLERDELDEEQAMKRIRAQLPIEQKKEWADYLIDNQGTREETEEQVDQLLAKIKAELAT